MGVENEEMNELTAPTEVFDVIVVGGGHAGLRSRHHQCSPGAEHGTVHLNLDRIAWQPCNPAVGGPRQKPTGA